MCAALIAATLTLYAPVRGHEFINYDDPEYVVENGSVRRGLTLDGVLWAFTRSHSANWHPLTWLSHMIDCQLFGVRAGPHLLHSAVLHALAAALLFLFFWRTTNALGPSAFVAAVFALHPLRVESVAWVSERKDVLSAFFWMLTLHAYVAWVRAPGRGRRALLILSYLLGLMAKPMLVTLPFVLVLVDVWPLRRIESLRDWSRWAALAREKMPLFALAAVSCVITFSAQWQAGAVVPLVPEYGFAFRLQNALVSYATYITQTLWPTDLAIFYPPRSPVPLSRVLPAAALLAAISAAVAWLGRRHRYLLVGWLWYLGVLVPVIGVVWVGEQARADRFTYLPQIGLAVIVAWGLRDLLAARTARPAWTLAVPAALVLLAAAAATRAQLTYWVDTVTLFDRALEVTENNHVVHANLASELSKRGQPAAAIRHVEEALRIKPAFPKAHLTLGALLAEQGRIEEALPHYDYAMRNQPESPTVHFNLGLAMVALGRPDEALRFYEEAILLDPGYAHPRVALAGLLRQKGRHDEAIQHLRAAVRARPDLAAAHGNLAIALEESGEAEEALEHYRETVRLAPADMRARFNLASVLAARGEFEEALGQLHEARRVDPDSESVRAAIDEVEELRAGGAR